MIMIMISYKDIPPGRARMLAYSNEINNRHNSISTSLARVLTEINQTNSIRVEDIVFGSTNRLNNLQISPFNEYEILSELTDVKVGLISKDLLDKSKIDSSKDLAFCTICQQDIFLDIVRTLDCSHSYHVNCIDRWFIDNKKCPQCRFEI
jgi:hypothetical protein